MAIQLLDDCASRAANKLAEMVQVAMVGISEQEQDVRLQAFIVAQKGSGTAWMNITVPEGDTFIF